MTAARGLRTACSLVLVAAGAQAGCAGGTPQPAQVKHAAREWAQARLHPAQLTVTLVVVARDERRARVRLRADRSAYDVWLRRPAGSGWTVRRTRRRS